MSGIPQNKIFTSTVWVLCFVSLFNDISSEMLYPVLPVYLRTIGFTALWIGILEGIAEAVVGISKGYFGELSDERGKRLPFIRWGYFLSGVSKSAIVLVAHPLWALFCRSGDKLGKGFRTGARDALLSDESLQGNRGKVFGLHRAMDTVGAAIGPILALVYLYYYPGHYVGLFYIAFAPALLSLVLTFLLKEKEKQVRPVRVKIKFFSYFSYWKKSTPEYRKVVAGLLLFALFNSADIFLLLMVKDLGFSDLDVISVYVFYNLVYAFFAYPLGHLADKQGMRNVLIFGFILFAIVYGGMAFVKDKTLIYCLFFIYGIYAAATDGVSKAWISKIAPKGETATAIGFHASFTSLCTMLASFIAGALWVGFEPVVTFAVTGIAAIGTVIYFLVVTRNED
jgi:MFS family permease